jgi:hypothetical protein
MIWKAYHDDKTCFANHFVPNYGKITPEMIWKQVAPRSETGDSQVICYGLFKTITFMLCIQIQQQCPRLSKTSQNRTSLTDSIKFGIDHLMIILDHNFAYSFYKLSIKISLINKLIIIHFP